MMRKTIFAVWVILLLVWYIGCDSTYKSSYSSTYNSDDYTVRYEYEDGTLIKTETAWSSVYLYSYSFEKTGYDVYFTLNGETVTGTVNISSNVTIVVHYTPKVYTIKFAKGSESSYVTGDLPFDMTADYDGTIVLPENTLVHSSKKSDGWQKTSSYYDDTVVYTDGQSVTVNSLVSSYYDEITLYAHFRQGEYKLTFYYYGYDSFYGNKYVYADAGDKISDSQVPTANTKSGYTFKGWYRENDANETLIDWTTYTVTKDETFMPKYESSSYKVTFVSDIGTPPSQITVEAGTTKYLSSYTISSQNGYTFDGWEDENGEKVTYIYQSAYGELHDVTLTARWRLWKAEMYFYSTGYYLDGSTRRQVTGIKGTMESQEWTYGQTQRISENQYYANGYKFIGWATSSYSTTVTYTDKQYITWNGSTPWSYDGATKYLYPVFEALPVTVTLKVQAESNPADITLTFDSNKNCLRAEYDGISVYQWYIDGVLCENERAATLSVNAIGIGTHSVMVRADKDGIIYSQTAVLNVALAE